MKKFITSLLLLVMVLTCSCVKPHPAESSPATDITQTAKRSDEESQIPESTTGLEDEVQSLPDMLATEQKNSQEIDLYTDVYICDLPIYVTAEHDFSETFPEALTVHQVSAGEQLDHQVFFYYPGTLTDFKIYSLQYDFEVEREGYRIVDTVFHQDHLTEYEAVFWSGYFGDIFTNLAFSFVDPDGKERVFTVEWLMDGGTLTQPYIIIERELQDQIIRPLDN